MKTIRIRSLVIETTRKCNIQCQHCLRGDAQCMDFDVKYLKALLEQDIEVQGITLSGGEPSLVVPVLKQIRETMKEFHRYELWNFYLATNGVDISEEFVLEMLRWYSFCSEKEACKVDLSNDQYHEDECSPSLDLLEGLSFFGKKFEKSNYYEGIREGRNKDRTTATVCEEDLEVEIEDDIEIQTVYLNCKGMIIRGCDYSYESQEERIYCPVEDFSKRINEDYDEERKEMEEALSM